VEDIGGEVDRLVAAVVVVVVVAVVVMNATVRYGPERVTIREDRARLPWEEGTNLTMVSGGGKKLRGLLREREKGRKEEQEKKRRREHVGQASRTRCNCVAVLRALCGVVLVGGTWKLKEEEEEGPTTTRKIEAHTTHTTRSSERTERRATHLQNWRKTPGAFPFGEPRKLRSFFRLFGRGLLRTAVFSERRPQQEWPFFLVVDRREMERSMLFQLFNANLAWNSR
jgi:hypothetical protein